MIPGPDIIIRHPQVTELMRYRTYASRNNFGQTVWSDGRRDCPMMPDQPPILMSSCGVLFRLSECEVVKDELVDAARYNLDYPLEPSAATYLWALTSGFYRDRGEEYYLRERLWWRSNDPVRFGASEQPQYSSEEVTNLLSLIEMFVGEVEPARIVMCAEIHRELGNHKRCMELLGGQDFGEGLNSFADRIYFEASRSSSAVVPIVPFDENSPELIEGRRLRTLDGILKPVAGSVDKSAAGRKKRYEEAASVEKHRTQFREIGLGTIDRSILERRLPESGRILDAGCGVGRIALGLWELGKREIEACDFAEPQIKAAQTLAREKGANIKFFTADFRKLPVPDGHYDAIVCLGNTLGEISDEEERKAVMREFRRVVKVGGRLIFSMPRNYRHTEVEYLMSSPRFVPCDGWMGGQVSRDVGLGEVTEAEVRNFGYRGYQVSDRYESA